MNTNEPKTKYKLSALSLWNGNVHDQAIRGLLPDFGGPRGTLLLTRFDPEAMDSTEDWFSGGIRMHGEKSEPMRAG